MLTIEILWLRMLIIFVISIYLPNFNELSYSYVYIGNILIFGWNLWTRLRDLRLSFSRLLLFGLLLFFNFRNWSLLFLWLLDLFLFFFFLNLLFFLNRWSRLFLRNIKFNDPFKGRLSMRLSCVYLQTSYQGF